MATVADPIADIDIACTLVCHSGDVWTAMSTATRADLERAGWRLIGGGIYRRGPHQLTMVRTRLRLRLWPHF